MVVSKTRNAARWSRVLLWGVLVAPLAYQFRNYGSGAIYYGEILHWTGLHATHLLLLTLAVTPLSRFMKRGSLVLFLRRHRRDFGIATFVYSVAHAGVYVVRLADFTRVLDEAFEPGMLTGWISILIMAVLAATSNDLSVQHLGGRWRQLHSAVYAAAPLAVLHWVLTAFDPKVAYTYLAAVAFLLVLRLRRKRQPN